MNKYESLKTEINDYRNQCIKVVEDERFRMSGNLFFERYGCSQRETRNLNALSTHRLQTVVNNILESRKLPTFKSKYQVLRLKCKELVESYLDCNGGNAAVAKKMLLSPSSLTRSRRSIYLPALERLLEKIILLESNKNG